jgi:isochorismate synthase
MNNSAKSNHSVSISEWEILWHNAQKEQSAMAIWRLPNQEKTTLLIDKKGGKEINSLALEELGPGFIAAPFVGTPFLLQNSELSSGILEANFTAQSYDTFSIQDTNIKDYFIQKAKSAVEEIQAGKFQKVVLSRISQSEFSKEFSVLKAFLKLSLAYPKAFVSAFYLPSLQATWLCASPEALVEEDHNGLFKTIALAGTQSALNEKGEALSCQQATWTHKEIEEQAFVSRYIIDCFKKIRLREYDEIGPKTVIAGNLMHLKTEYVVDTKEVHLPDLSGIMLSLLHPTSAVCGTPKEAAIQWIKKAELHQREMYSGYLGPINIDKEIHLFVNLRTVKMEESAQKYLLTYYAGCGITEDSDIEKEWLETEMKTQTIKSVIETTR